MGSKIHTALVASAGVRNGRRQLLRTTSAVFGGVEPRSRSRSVQISDNVTGTLDTSSESCYLLPACVSTLNILSSRSPFSQSYDPPPPQEYYRLYNSIIDEYASPCSLIRASHRRRRRTMAPQLLAHSSSASSERLHVASQFVALFICSTV